MAGKKSRDGRKARPIEYPLPKERSKTAAQIETEKSRELWESSMERAMRLAHFMQLSFPDMDDHNYTNTECKAYVEKLRSAVSGGAGGVVVAAEAPVEDPLAEAIRAVLPDAPRPGAGSDACEAFAAGLAAVRTDGRSEAGSALAAACPDLPEDDAAACRDYVESLVDAAGRADSLAARLERFEALFGRLLSLAPEECASDPEMREKFDGAIATYLDGAMIEIKEVVKGALRDK